MTATEWARASLDGGVAVPPEVAEAARRSRGRGARASPMPTRPSGKRFGTLVHALLAHVALEAGPGDIAQLAAVQAGCSARPTTSGPPRPPWPASCCAIRCWPGPGPPPRPAASCRREVPLVLTVGPVLVDGQADLLWDDGDGWMVLDFKTDIELGGSTALYARQVAVYLEALRRATGRPARGALLRA